MTRNLEALLAGPMVVALVVALGTVVSGCGDSDDNGDNGDVVLCGNGVIDPGEDCDGEELGGTTCEDLGYYEGELACADDCTFDDSGCLGYCGDGEINGPEDCDGDELGGLSCEALGYHEGGELACTDDCALDESGCLGGYCGDGEINGPEDCDGDDLGGMTCADFGFYGGELACGADCNFDLSDCHDGFCGDDIINGPEDCDGSELGGMTCEALGYHEGGELACTEDCTFDESGCMGGYCGDGQINGPEQCDGEDLGGTTCEDLGYYFGALGCAADCTFDDSGCGGYCGDGIVHAEYGEVCDDRVNDGVYGCATDCMDFAPAYCGDGVAHIDHGEQCDGEDLGGATCESLGFDGGVLVCSDACMLDTSGCVSHFTCGETLVDQRDGSQYETVELGSLCWMATNLNVGERIDSGEQQDDPDVIQKYCYDDDSAMCDTHGGLYQWPQTMQYSTEEGTAGICPAGWRVPTDDEWKDLEISLGMTQEEADLANTWRGEGVGSAIKEGGSSGFEGLLGGGRWGAEDFRFLGTMGYYWTSTLGSTHPWRRCLSSSPAYAEEVGRWDTFPASFGFSVRCVRD